MYSKEFKEKLKSVFPDNKELHRKLDEEGDCKKLNDFLYNLFKTGERWCVGDISDRLIEEILTADSLAVLQDTVREYKEKRSIYFEWICCQKKGNKEKDNKEKDWWKDSFF